MRVDSFDEMRNVTPQVPDDLDDRALLLAWQSCGE
jgi:hypothetical protein